MHEITEVVYKIKQKISVQIFILIEITLDFTGNSFLTLELQNSFITDRRETTLYHKPCIEQLAA